MNTWVKLHRKLLSWEWYKSPNHLHLFVYLLIKANHKDGRWQGMKIKRGEHVTSLGIIASETGLSKQNIRTILKNLKKSGEINTIPNTKLTHVTICNYDSYQGSDNKVNTPPNTELTRSQHDANTELTTNKKEKEEIKKKRTIKKFQPPTVEEVIKYFFEKGYTAEHARKAFDYYDAADWHDAKGNKVKNWKQKMISVWMKEEGKRPPTCEEDFTY